MTSHFPSAIPAGSFYALQDFFWPDRDDGARLAVFFRLPGGHSYEAGAHMLTFALGDHVSFDCAANLFNLATWQEFCALDSLLLKLSGEGVFVLELVQTLPDMSQQVLAVHEVTLRGASVWGDVSLPVSIAGQGGILHFTLRALTPGRLVDACWGTNMPPRRLPQLTLVITTFRREQAVMATVVRFHDFMAQSDLAGHVHLLVIDNGQTLSCADTPFMRRIPNENLGGSGGFTRGLLEAQQAGASHCLFMDDDASIQMGALARCWRFLAYALGSDVAVAGGLLSAQNAAEVWENGALFNGICRPLHMGTDLRDFSEVCEMEFAGDARTRVNFYGGWWFFAFPVNAVTYFPFPFFVRGDDVSFCLANRFKIAGLPGLFSRQEADFSQKETLQTVYLDLRSHLAHHLALPSMARGRFGCFKTAVIFYLRALVQCKYETIEAINLALDDVMRGPSFFVDDADMAQRRSDLGALCRSERYVPLVDAVPVEHVFISPDRPIWRFFMKITLNGHLLPFFGYFGNHLVWHAGARRRIRAFWGAAQLTFVNDRGEGFTLHHSKKRALVPSLRFVRRAIGFFRCYSKLVVLWQEGYKDVTTAASWRKLLKISAAHSDG